MCFDDDNCNEEDVDEDLIVNNKANSNAATQPWDGQQPIEQQEAAQQPITTTTRSGRTIKAPIRLLEEMEAAAMDEVSEIMAFGAGIGGGFVHMSELKPMKCEEAIEKDPVGWGKAVNKEHECMTSHAVFKAVPKNQAPESAKS